MTHSHNCNHFTGKKRFKTPKRKKRIKTKHKHINKYEQKGR